MLPNFPKIVAQRDRHNVELIQRLIDQKAPMLVGISGFIVHEGSVTSIARPSGAVEPTEMQKHSAFVEIEKIKLVEFLPRVMEYLEAIAEQFAESRSTQVIAVMTETTSATGNIVDGKGQPFSEDLMYATLEKMSHSFGENGEWQAPSQVVGPELHAKIIEYDKTRTPEQKAAFEQKLKSLIAIKKAEYDLEQAGRILAG